MLRSGGIYIGLVEGKAVCFSETFESIDESTRRQTPEEHHRPHRHENLKLHMEGRIFFVNVARFFEDLAYKKIKIV
jgi:hypothetical protein